MKLYALIKKDTDLIYCIWSGVYPKIMLFSIDAVPSVDDLQLYNSEKVARGILTKIRNVYTKRKDIKKLDLLKDAVVQEVEVNIKIL